MIAVAERIGFFVNTDYCNGCQACQVACREINRVPFGETWLTVIRDKPKMRGGDKLQMRFSHIPELDKCALCLKEEEEPYCQAICPSKCLKVAYYRDMAPVLADSDDRWSVSVATAESEG